MHTCTIHLICITIITKIFPTILALCESSKWKYVASCPKNEAEWKNASSKLNCSSIHQSCVYHCLRNEFQNGSLEGCAMPQKIVGKYCAEYNMHGHKVQPNYELSCAEDTCPCPLSYFSNETFKYISCLILDLAKPYSVNIYEEKTPGNKNVVLIVTCVIETLCLFACVILLVFCHVRHKKTKEKSVGKKDGENSSIVTSHGDGNTDNAQQRQALLENMERRGNFSSAPVARRRHISVCSTDSSATSTLSLDGLQFVVVFNIGKKYTGYGFSVRKSDGRLHSARTGKILSAILLDRDHMTREIKFDINGTLCGFDAREKYEKLKSQDKRKCHLFFPDFHVKKKDENYVVEDITGVEKNAEEILKYFLLCLQTIAKHRIRERKGDPTYENTRYVLISRVLEKEILTNAALQSGIKKDKLKVIEEKDAYPLCLRQGTKDMLCLNCTFSDLRTLFEENSMYIVLDIREGGVNLVINRKKGDEMDTTELQEYIPWNRACITNKYMEEIFFGLLGKDCIDELMANHYAEYVKLLEMIEEHKRNISPKEALEMIIHLPSVFYDIVTKNSQLTLHRAVETSGSKFAKNVKIKNIANDDIELKISSELIYSEVFQPSIRKMKHKLQQKVPENYMSEIVFVYLIGEYANYIFMRNVVTEHFTNVPVIIPSSPDLVVVEGAAFHKEKMK